MSETLNAKKQLVVSTLINRLTSRNLDYDLCLNAHTILLELADNESTFGKLAEKENLIPLIRAACDLRNPN